MKHVGSGTYDVITAGWYALLHPQRAGALLSHRSLARWCDWAGAVGVQFGAGGAVAGWSFPLQYCHGRIEDCAAGHGGRHAVG